MICNYVFGHPVRTDAVVEPVKAITDFEPGQIPYVTVSTDAQGHLCITRSLQVNDFVYGLGETMHGLNKRGFRYISYNTDDPNQREDMPSMYCAHNLLVVDGAEKFGIFVDTPAKVTFDVGCADPDTLQITAETDSMNLYILSGVSAYDIVKQFLFVIGKSHIPPLYAFGYGQSRWGYETQADFEAVADGYKKIGVPLDYICMDIDYMDRFIDFTVNTRRFPDFAGFVAEMKQRGIHMVPIIDAGIKIEPGNPVYEEGLKSRYFCTNREGKPFGAAVWPGMTHFTDFLRPDARAWFGRQYKFLTDMGVDGFWNDMNEPAIFYTETQPVPPMFDPNVDAETAQKIADLEAAVAATEESNAYKGYKEFYHEIDGKRVLHHDVHNLFGAMMTRAAGEFLDKELDGKYFLFSRSSYIGAHRYGGIWAGDNYSSWEMLRQSLRHITNLNMVGFIYTGADVGGFNGNCSRELLLRWLAFGDWTPLMRNHSARGTTPQECYQFDHPEDFRAVVGLRYRMLPYIYESFVAAAENRDMYIKPLAFVFDDEKCRTIEDQLMVGESVMIAPVVEEGAQSRTVYLPEPMTEVRYNGEAFACTQKPAGETGVNVPLNEVVFYIRNGHKVKTARRLAMHTGEIDLNDVEYIG